MTQLQLPRWDFCSSLVRWQCNASDMISKETLSSFKFIILYFEASLNPLTLDALDSLSHQRARQIRVC